MMREFKRYEKYKDSGVEWIGEIPEGWVFSKVKFYSNIESGEYISKDEYLYNGEFNIYGSNGKIGKTNKFNFNGNGLIIGRVGAAGEINYANRGWITDNALIIKTQNINERYFYFYLESIDFDIITGKTAQPIITATNFKNLNCLIPSKKEQQKIASFLDQKTAEIDEIINKKEKLIDYLEKYKKSVITEAVTKGKLGDKYINEDGELVDEIEMKDSGVEWVGEIPKHFDIIPIKRLLIGIKDGTHGTHKRVNNGKLLLSAKNVYNGGIKINNDESIITEKEYKKIISNGYPRKGDILFTCVGTIGRCCVYKKDKPLAFQRSVSFLRFSNNTNKEFYKYVLQSTFFQEQIQMKLKSTAQSGIYMGDIENTNIVKVDLKIQNRISIFLENKMKELNTLIQKTKASIQKYKEYKKSLIFEAVTGKIDLRDYQLKGGEELAEHRDTKTADRKRASKVN